MIRALLSTIKNLGAAPCLRCLIKKKHIPDVGTRSDVRRRRPRIDNPRRREAVEDARKAMFEKGSSITSKDVQKHLEVRSMVPTRVSVVPYGQYLLTHSSECILRRTNTRRTRLPRPFRRGHPSRV